MTKIRSFLIGDKPFYRRAFRIALPIVIQNAVTNFVSLLDNLMIGRLGTEQMTGVSIANQLVFVYNLLIFGVVSGIGIFTTQFFGAGDEQGVRHTFRVKVIASGFTAIVAGLLFFFFDDFLLRLFFTEDGSGVDLLLALQSGKEYLFVILFGLIPFALTQAYSGTLREGGESAVPMLAGVSAIAVNVSLNLILIFGYLGAPALGVTGAAIATVASRFVELLIVLVYTHAKAARWGFITGAYRRLFSVPGKLIGQLAVKSFPLIANELLWSVGTSAVVRNYSTRGLSVVAALTITTTVANVFNSVNFGIGASVSIVAGQSLGADRLDDAQRDACRMIALATFSCLFVGGALAALAPFFPLIYNTEPAVRDLSTSLLLVAAACMPIGAFMQASYFTIRSGGKTLVTFLFDSVFVLAVSFPASYLLAAKTTLPIVRVYLIVTLLDLIKCIVGFILIRRRVWLHNIVSDQTAA